MAKVKPIKPNQVAETKKTTIPDEVFQAFNELITENFRGNSATVTQPDAVKRMVDKGLNRNDIYEKGWLDIEEVYELAGWNVKYDRPGWDETYEPYFVFTRRR